MHKHKHNITALSCALENDDKGCFCVTWREKFKENSIKKEFYIHNIYIYLRTICFLLNILNQMLYLI